MTTETRFWAKVGKDGPAPEGRPELGPCWLWTAYKDRRGYGRFWLDGRLQQAHRVAYEWLVGPIPDGLQIDHLCRTPACVNPKHLEPVTGRVNTLRGDTLPAAQVARTRCPQGHPYDGANLYVRPNGWRECRTCHREKHRRYRAKRRAA